MFLQHLIRWAIVSSPFFVEVAFSFTIFSILALHVFVRKTWACAARISSSVSFFNYPLQLPVLVVICFVYLLCTGHVILSLAMSLLYSWFDFSCRPIWSLQCSATLHGTLASVHLLHWPSDMLPMAFFLLQLYLQNSTCAVLCYLFN